MPFREAVDAVLAGGQQGLTLSRSEAEPSATEPSATRHRMEAQPPPKLLILPEKALVPLQLYDYLYRGRGIDLDIIKALIRERKIYEDVNGNVVFIGYDEHNAPRYASKRGTCGANGVYGYKADCTGSDKRYAFRMAYVASAASTSRMTSPSDPSMTNLPDSSVLYVFEAPIDAMSHATIMNIITGEADAWRRDSRLSLGGVTELALEGYLEVHGRVDELVFCLDNDAQGREAAERMTRRYADKGHRTRIELPENKDYNDDLVKLRWKRRML